MPTRRLLSALAAVALAALLAHPAVACTTFCFRSPGGVVFGKNYDWSIGYGLVVVNKRGVAKTAALEATDRPASWTAKYGSVTFNQFGRDTPNGGMNEAGLIVELMWLEDTKYPAADARPSVGTLGWIQYQLDRHATVQEVLDHADEIRISSSVPIHYLIADKSGAAATVEFLKGKLVCHEGSSLPVAALTNDTYDRSLDYLKRHQGFGGAAPPRSGPGSLDRFVRAAEAFRNFKADDSAVDYAFQTLANVAQGDYTKWSIVYDAGKQRIHFRTFDSPRVRFLDLKAFDFSCATPVKVLDINAALAGDVAGKFVEYTREANRALIFKSFRNVEFLASTPDAELDRLAAYPETTTCAE